MTATAFCLLPSAFCLLPSAFCLLNLCNKPTTSCFLSKNLCCQESNIWLSELKRSSHHLVPLSRDAVVISFKDLKDQFVCAQQSKQATDASRTVFGIALTQGSTKIVIPEAFLRKHAIHDD